MLRDRSPATSNASRACSIGSTPVSRGRTSISPRRQAIDRGREQRVEAEAAQHGQLLGHDAVRRDRDGPAGSEPTCTIVPPARTASIAEFSAAATPDASNTTS